MFSVIIPTFNRPAYLKSAIESVLAQSIELLELIVVDDGDGSGLATANSFADPRIIALANLRRGPVPARNLAIGVASNDYIAFLDDDDWWQGRDHLQSAERRLAAGAHFYFADGELALSMEGGRRIPFCFTADRESLECDNTILISSVAYRRSLHNNLGKFDENLPYYWDWDWYLRVARSGARFAHDDNIAVAIRTHSGNMSGDGSQAERRANLDRFAAKHRLPRLELRNHLSIALEA